ncbi:MAG TPA: NADH-quinone oxidoreductase subunit C [Candidatus Thermoplasmatota archaeon]|nr:NADH-quinone oxidoreductase subunit C [Candidatus Thermoplasmatota archaeon]
MADKRTPAADDPGTKASTRKGEPGAAPPASGTQPAPDQATASPAGPRAPSARTAGAATPSPVEPGNVPAKPAPTPPAPAAPEPQGDLAMLRDAHPGDAVGHEVLQDGAGVLTVTSDGLPLVAAEVKAMGYRILSLLSAYDRGDHFGVLYAFVKPATSPGEFAELRLRVTMPKSAGEPSLPSLTSVFPAADWQEREMFDMYGIRFEGHPDLRRVFLPSDWTGHPMRKDYKEPEQFVALREGEDITVKSPEEGAW